MTTAADLLAGKTLRETTITLNAGDGGLVELTLRALPRKQYRELIEAHPPTDGDPAKDWDENTFPPALIAATVAEPAFTVDEAQQLWDEWEVSEAGRLFLTCHHLNENPDLLGFIWPGSATTSGSGPNSTTASQGESPTPSSSPGGKKTRTKPSPTSS